MNWIRLFEQVLRGENIETEPTPPESTWGYEHAIWRYWKAKSSNPQSIRDHATLARQCLRWILPYRVRGDHLNAGQLRDLETAGVRLGITGYLDTVPYRPSWLGEGLSSNVLDGVPSVAGTDEVFAAEPWLIRATGKSTWRSPAQKEACWTVLTAPPGSTSLIGLPTGAGKSLVFQVTAALSSGLTVVVVPTIALGLDQLASAQKLPSASALNPMNYCAGPDADSVRDSVANHHCRLLFTSPEAIVSGRLRSLLSGFASDGWLKCIVVDEAHIVESWGADFRIEFQLLGALVRDWRQKSLGQFKTILLSATFADSTRETLRRLFAEERGHWIERVAQRLRPEIHYHIQRAATDDQQVEWVSEAVRYLPRPLILYVTEKAEAEKWYARLDGEGYRRLACFHGDTVELDRRRIMDDWRNDQLDVVVATSAFGMGVDKADVRAVVHACFPESLDRFYQEVGRSGRDGASSQSVLVYTDADEQTGKSLSPTLLVPKTISDRWASLWETRRFVEEEQCFQVRTSARRSKFIGRRTYQENVRWNKRLLQMLHRAELLSVTGLKADESDIPGEYVEWVSISDLRFPPIDPNVGERLESVRRTELDTIARGYESLRRCAQGTAVCRELKRHYGTSVARACGSCRSCRSGNELPRTRRPLEWPEESPRTSPTVSVVPFSGRANDFRARSDWVLAIRRAVLGDAVDQFVVAEHDFPFVFGLFSEALEQSANYALYRVDPWRKAEGGQPFIPESSRVVVLHPLIFDGELGALNEFGSICSHWMPKDQVVDPYGRSRYTSEHGAQLFDNVEFWRFQYQTKET